MKKRVLCTLIALTLVFSAAFPSFAAFSVYKVRSGDSLWKIATRIKTGISELLKANPSVSQKPDVIYPGQEIIVPESDPDASAYESEVIRLVNAERAKYGLSALSENWELSRVARYKSRDMSEKGYFAHESPTYGTPFQMMKSFGISYRTAGENIAYGQKTPEAVVRAWMNSSGHRANILNASFKQIGVGFEPNGRYWTQMFIG